MIALNEEERPCLSVGALSHPLSGASPSSDASEGSDSPSSIAILLRIADRVTAEKLFAPYMAFVREGDGETFESEFAHSAFACLDVVCRQERCVALQERLLALRPDRFTRCAVCGCTVSNIARLDCNGGCAS